MLYFIHLVSKLIKMFSDFVNLFIDESKKKVIRQLRMYKYVNERMAKNLKINLRKKYLPNCLNV